MVWKPLKGIITPLSTPLLRQDVVDKAGTKRLIDHVISGGVSGIFVLGSTGEGPALSYECRKDFIQHCCEIVAGRVPVLVGVSDAAFAQTISLAKTAHESGAAAIVLTQPYYYLMGQSEMVDYVEMILESIPHELSVMLYNIPVLTKSSWNVETVRTLAECHPQVVGMKDSSGDLPYFEQLCRIKSEFPDFTIMMGQEHLLSEAVKAGGDGFMNGGSNMLPILFVSLYKEIVGGEDYQKIEALKEGVHALQDIYGLASLKENPFSRLISGIKCGLAAKSICGMYVNRPFISYTDDHLAKASHIISEIEQQLQRVL